MARAAFIKDGIVYSVADVAASADDLEHGIMDGKTVAMVLDDNAQVGDAWDAKTGFVNKNIAPATDKIVQALLKWGMAQASIDEVLKLASTM